MNKVELQNLCTAPPREWLAIPKKMLTTRDKPFTFSFSDIISVGGEPYVWDETHTRQYKLSDCHICASIGKEYNGEKLFSGSLVSCSYDGEKRLGYIKYRIGVAAYSIQFKDGFILLYEAHNITIIGHIHTSKLGTSGIPSEWPEEVRELLEEGADDGS